jgi:hypothetical protein
VLEGYPTRTDEGRAEKELDWVERGDVDRETGGRLGLELECVGVPVTAIELGCMVLEASGRLRLELVLAGG